MTVQPVKWRPGTLIQFWRGTEAKISVNGDKVKIPAGEVAVVVEEIDWEKFWNKKADRDNDWGVYIQCTTIRHPDGRLLVFYASPGHFEPADEDQDAEAEELKHKNSLPEATECYGCGGPLKIPIPGIKYCPDCEGD